MFGSSAKALALMQMVIGLGLGLLLLGAIGDIAYHALPHQLSHDLVPWLGVEGQRAHLTTLLGMLVVLLGVVWKGVRRTDQR